jgi:hypothetical protein
MDKLKIFGVLSQVTYGPYWVHLASLQAEQYTSQQVAGKGEQTSTSLPWI